jgi:hypothetical protein
MFFSNMCKTWGRILMRIGVVLIQIWIGVNKFQCFFQNIENYDTYDNDGNDKKLN